ncbi:hypothetical protein D030_1463A, partial [Vibrio parahaemolyticus AQ3810]
MAANITAYKTLPPSSTVD